MKRKAAFVLVALLLATMGLAPAPASAGTTYTWNGGTGDWSAPGNWSPSPGGGAPSGYNGDTAIVDGKAGVASVVQLNNTYGSPSVNSLLINSGDEVRFSYSTTPQFTFAKSSTSANPTLVNDGIFRLANTGALAQISASSPLTISSPGGTGKIIMESSATSSLTGSGGFYNLAGHTIEGVGTISTIMSNYGMIQAKGDRLLMLGNFYNYTGGVLRSSPGAVLQMGIWDTPSSGRSINYNGSGGLLDLNGGTLKVENATFINPDIRNSGAGGTMEINHAAGTVDFRGTTNLGSGLVVNVNNAQMYANQIGADTYVVNNDGVINVKATGGISSSFLSPGGTLTGSGRLVLNGNANAAVSGGGAYDTTSLTQDVNHTIEGGGKLSGKIINNGTILANNGNLTINGPVSGTGQVQVKDGGKLILTYIGAPAAGLTTQNLSMTRNAAIQVGGNTYVSTSNFSYAMQNGSGWSWDDSSTLKMTGYGPGHYLEVGGIPGTDPYTNNFYIPNLIINGDATLVDLFDNQTGFDGHEALYVKNLTFTGSTLNLNNLSLYVWDGSAFDLVEVGDYPGHIVNTPVPVPPAVWLLGSGLLGLVGWRRKFKA